LEVEAENGEACEDIYRLEDRRCSRENVCDLRLGFVDVHLCDKEWLPHQVVLDQEKLGLAVLGDSGKNVDIVLDYEGPPVLAATSAVARKMRRSVKKRKEPSQED
jgi:hypothetical protein